MQRWLMFVSVTGVILWWVIPYLRVAVARVKAKRADLYEQSDESIASIPAEYDEVEEKTGEE